MALEDYYNNNPIAVIDQNSWDDRVAQVVMNFQSAPVVYTPLIEWMDRSRATGAEASIFTDLIEGDVNTDDIAYDALYIPEPLTIDSRSRTTSMKRYGDKIQVQKSSSYFQQWQMSGGRDWRPLMKAVLSNNVRRKIEGVSRNAFFQTPSTFWTYGGSATNFLGLGNTSKFSLDIANAWNLRLGQTGSPVVPGGLMNEKIVIIPPGCVYDFQESLAAASNNEAALWRSAMLYGGSALKYEIGSYKNIRFVEAPNDNYGQNPSVLYNCGKIAKQVNVTSPITAGAGSPDPETTTVDGTWRVGQKDVTHYISCSVFGASDFEINDQVTLHTVRTAAYGVTNGVEFRSGKTITRRIVAIDRDEDPSSGYYHLSFDRPVMSNYTTEITSGVYGYITKGTHVGFCLALGSGGGLKGNVNKPLEFYEPVPVDDFNSVYRFTWDFIGGISVWEPNSFELHFVGVSLPKPGGVIDPPAP